MSNAFGKRVFDVVASGVALALSLPILLVIALIVRMDTPGPVLFRQVRVGRHGRPFEILKFRTMIDQPTSFGQEITLHQDSRITRSGKILRQWKLDELPQLLNVFCGDMSVVGPRPEVPRYVAFYPPIQREIVLSVRPGITDPASIKYRSESEMLADALDPEQLYREVILPDKLALAVDYASKVSLFSDMVIILRTLRRITH